MRGQKQLTPTPHFLQLTWRDDGRPSVGTALSSLQPVELLATLMFPSVKEQDSLEKLSQAMNRPTVARTATTQDLVRASGALSDLMAIEMRNGARGFAAAMPDGSIRIYLHASGIPANAQVPLTNKMSEISRERGIPISMIGISRNDMEFLDGASDRVATQCLFSNIAALLVPMREEGKGTEAGVREALRRNNSQ